MMGDMSDSARMGRPRSRLFWVFLGADTVSTVGSAITAVALPLTAITLLDATTFQMGMVTAAGFVAWLVVGLPAGAIIQRLPLRGTQVSMDMMRATTVLSIPITWWWGHLTISHLVVAALVLGFADVFFEVATSTFLPEIVPSEQLESRNALMSGTTSATQLTGAPLGGLLVQLFGPVYTLLADAVSYAVSGLLLRTLPARRVSLPESWPPIRSMVAEGWTFVVRHPVLGPCLWFASAVNFVCGVQLALVPVYLVRELGAPAAVVGLLLASEGVGAIAGAAASGRLTRAFGSARTCRVAGVAATLGALVIPLGGDLAYFLFALGNIIFAAAVAVFSIASRTYQQTHSRRGMLPRVLATVRFVSFGAVPVGALLGGAVASAVGTRTALLALGTATVAAPLALYRSPVRSATNFSDVLIPGASDRDPVMAEDGAP